MYPNSSLCPERVKESLDNYVNHRLQPGGFLVAVLSNNLVEAFNRADESNMEAMPHIVAYLYNKLPRNCWGSPDRVEFYLAKRDLDSGKHPEDREDADQY